MDPKVALQYVAYWSPEAAKDIDACMESLCSMDYDREQVRLIVVDNPSPHGTARVQFEERWMNHPDLPAIEFLDAPSNDGFSGGHNRAYAAAEAWGAEYVYLLNQDALVDPGFLQAAVAYAQANPEQPIVQSLIVSAQDRTSVDSYGNVLHYLGFGYQDPDGHRPHFYASGAGMLVRTDVINEIGGLFETAYFMYHEDVDLSWRVRLAGYGVGVARDSVVYHRYEFTRSIGKFYWMERNRILTHLTHLRWGTLLLLLPMWKVMELGALVFAVRGGWLGTKVRAYGYFAKTKTWVWILERRRAIAALRRVDDRDLLPLMVSTIEAQQVEIGTLERLANHAMRVYGRVLRALVRW